MWKVYFITFDTFENCIIKICRFFSLLAWYKLMYKIIKMNKAFFVMDCFNFYYHSQVAHWSSRILAESFTHHNSWESFFQFSSHIRLRYCFISSIKCVAFSSSPTLIYNSLMKLLKNQSIINLSFPF